MKITHIALKTNDGTIFKGKKDGASLICDAIKNGHDINIDNIGFITSEGHFVSRQEAAKIAFEAGQIKKIVGRLSSHDLKL